MQRVYDKFATKPNEESPNNMHRSNSFLILFAEVRHSAKIVHIFCNQQDTNGLKRWSVIAYTQTQQSFKQRKIAHI